MIVEQIRASFKPGDVIFKPNAHSDAVVKGWGVRDGEKALIFRLPGSKRSDQGAQSGVTVGEWEKAFRQLRQGGFTRSWFDHHLARCAAEDGANFTTIGAVFEFLGYAAYERGAYYPKKDSVRAGSRVARVADLRI